MPTTAAVSEPPMVSNPIEASVDKMSAEQESKPTAARDGEASWTSDFGSVPQAGDFCNTSNGIGL